jgi:ATP-binding cassette subfamily C protein
MSTAPADPDGALSASGAKRQAGPQTAPGAEHKPGTEPGTEPGAEHELDGHRRLRPSPAEAVLVTAGVVEVFLVSEALPPTAPRHLVTLQAGEALSGTGWRTELTTGEEVELVGNGPATVHVLTPPAPAPDAPLSTGPAPADLTTASPAPTAPPSASPAPAGPPSASPAPDASILTGQTFRNPELAERLTELRQADDSFAIMQRRLLAEERRRQEANATLAALLGRTSYLPAAGLEGADTADGSPALRALLTAARAAGLDPVARTVESARAHPDLGVAQLAARLRIPVREVELSGSWASEDGIPVVALDRDGVPTALLRRHRSWWAWSSEAGWRQADPSTEWTSAWCVYPAFPARPLKLRDILRTGLPPGGRRDLVRIALASLAVMMLGAGVPLAAASILGHSVPRAEQGNLLAVTVLVAGLIVAFSAASVVQGLLLQRLVVQVNLRTTAALWARVLRLEPSFFRAYNPGELARRVLSVDGIRDLVTSSVIAAGIGLLIGFTGIVVTFLLDARIGLFALAGLVVYAVFVATWLRRMVRARRREVAERNAIGGFVTALLTGIVKVRVANAENRVYTRWAAMFARQQSASLGALAAQRQLTVLTGMLPALSTLLIVSVTTYVYEADLSIGAFVGLIAALSQVTTALSLVTPALGQLTDAVPLYDAARPVFSTAPRAAAQADDPGPLLGGVEISKASFSYSEEAPLTLSAVDLTAAPGEFVAVVGPSGAGKSTLIRLLLGFDRPGSGAVLFDGKPLDTLDVEAVRRQIGVVMQNAQVPTGSLLTAIVGTSNLTQDQAWEALEMAGLADDVRRMPMGIRTVISDGGSTFSGGQRQRLMIAKALVNRPRILVFDEATSALDNLTQQVVTHSLRELEATRVVIAHRLSTIADADRIYVMERGRVVEQGQFAELVELGGTFTRLARRQLL